MIIFMDFGTLGVLLLLLLAVMAGTTMTVAEWIISHLAIVLIMLLIKGFLIVGVFGGLRKSWEYLAIPLDMLRSGAVLWMLLDGVRSAFSGGLFNLIFTGFGLLIGGGLLIAASEAPIAGIAEESPLLAEIISIVLVSLCALVVYGLFDGW